MSKPLFVAIDVETTLNAPPDLGSAHPCHKDNHIVLAGLARPSGVTHTYPLSQLEVYNEILLDYA